MNHKGGFTVVEVTAAVLLLVMALGLALAGYIYSLKNINEGDIQNELDIDVQLAMERLKIDLRLSSLDTMFYHPAGPGPYEAISFPMAEDNDGNGVLEKNAEGNIAWDETVIYHIRPTTPNQLVKTTFKPRDDTLSDAQRQAQLESVVNVGHGRSTYNGHNASSKVIFENLLHWEIMPEKGQFDAYAPVLIRDSSSLGYILLDQGTHKFTFNVIDKNSSSSGYKVGIDQLFVSPSYSAREAEDQLPVFAQSGATASAQYMPGDWKGNYQLTFPATAAGHNFTLTLDNDRWEETNFGAVGYQATETEIIFDDTLSPADFTVQMAGMDTSWDSATQTGDEIGSDPSGLLKNAAVRIMQKGADLADNGNWFNYNGQQCRLTFTASSAEAFKVLNVFIGESSSSTNAIMDYENSAAAPVRAVKFNGYNNAVIPAGETLTSDWINLPIDRDKNYLVSFRVANNAALDAPKQWFDQRAMDPLYPTPLTTMVVENAGSAIAKDKSWSDRADITPYMTNLIFGLESIDVSYPLNGVYTSQIVDTHLTNPRYGEISWNADVPSGTSLSFKIRSGDQPDLSDAADWSLITASSVNPHAISASYKRYVQFQTLFTSDATGAATPKLKDVTIDWAGERQLVNIGGIFTKGPDYGIFEISVDGDPLRSALIVDLEIYKDILAMNKETRRVTSSLKADLTPRNSGL